MLIEEFNQLSLDEKFTFFRESLGDRVCGFFNLLIFEDKAIIAQFKQSGRPEYAHAYNVPKTNREIARMRLKRMGYTCAISFWNNIDEAEKNAITERFIYQSQN